MLDLRAGGDDDGGDDAGHGAPMWSGLPVSALGVRRRRPWPCGRHADRPGLAVQLEEDADLAVVLVSPTAIRRISMILPGSISAEISLPGSIP